MLRPSLLSLLLAGSACAQTYYVSPSGSDAADGLTPATAWATLDKVSTTAYTPGASILFERGGQWRGRLTASSSGSPLAPITYGAYGAGAKPTFYGSDVVNKSTLAPVAGQTYSLPSSLPIGSVLANGDFLANAWLLNDRTNDAAVNKAYVAANPNSYFYDTADQRLYLNLGGDPVADARQITAVTRDDVVYSNAKNNLVFRDLVVEESAIFNAGYAFRVQGSENVQILDSEAYRAGKHHFGVINSTDFLGKGLKAAIAMPSQGVGGASALVSYADYNFENRTSVWEDVEILDLGDPTYPAYLSHGEGLGPIQLRNIRSIGSSISVGANTTASDLLVVGAGIDVGGGTVNRARLVGANAGIAFWGDAEATNVVVEGFYRTAGVASPLSVRGENNKLQFSTITTAATGQVDSLLVFPNVFAKPEEPEHIELLGNVFGNSRPIQIVSNPEFDASYVSGDYNVYENAVFRVWYGRPELTFAQWQAFTGETNSQVGSASFIDFVQSDFHLAQDAVGAKLVPIDVLDDDGWSDFESEARDSGWFADAGAFETPTTSADLDRDGDVDGMDFLLWQQFGGDAGFQRWLAQFSPNDGAVAVPEPAATMLAKLAALAFYGGRRRAK